MEHHPNRHLGPIVVPHALVALVAQPTLRLRSHLPPAGAVGSARGRGRPLPIPAAD